MALEIARAVQTPFPPPDISSPSRSLANLSFIKSTSAGFKNNKRSLIFRFLVLHCVRLCSDSILLYITNQNQKQDPNRIDLKLKVNNNFLNSIRISTI